jgi:hypothetical protein
MTVAKARAVVAANGKAEQGTLLEAVHERCVWDAAAFWEFYEAIRVLARAARRKPLPLLIPREIVHLSHHVFFLAVCHLSPEDSYVMKRFPKRQMSAYLDRLRTAVDGMLTASVVPDSAFGDGLRSPFEG